MQVVTLPHIWTESFFIHIIMGLKLAPVILAGSSSLVMLGLYYLVRFRSCFYIPKVILTGLGLIMLDLTWYSKFLSNGPVLFFILIFAALVIWVWQGKCLAILLAIYFLNLAVLGIIDSNAIIAQTAYAMLGDREKAITAGCVDYINKPLESRRLLELVSTYLYGQN